MRIVKNIFASVLILLCNLTYGQKQLHFTSIDSLLAYAEKNSFNTKINSEQSLLAKWNKIAATATAVNFRNPVNASLINNTKLPINFLPAEAFGGIPGTFKEVNLGLQYITNYNFSPQIDLINFSAWEKIKGAEINIGLTDVNNLLAKKSLFESVAASYFNSISLKIQMSLLKQSITAADTVLQLVTNKFHEGIIRSQDVNDAKINKLNLEEKYLQAEFSLQQQIINLKILCDIADSVSVFISEKEADLIQLPSMLIANSNLLYQKAKLQNAYSEAEIKSIKLSQLPTLSFAYYNSLQNNSSNSFFDHSQRWLNASYYSLRLSWNFPDISKHISLKMANISGNIASINLEHTALQNKLSNQQLEVDYQKALSQVNKTENIYILKKDNYSKSIKQYNENILPLDRLLTYFNDMWSSKLNTALLQTDAKFLKSKIDINNTVK